jgi:hypothetical protein
MNHAGEDIPFHTFIPKVASSNLGLIKIFRGSPQALQIKV